MALGITDGGRNPSSTATMVDRKGAKPRFTLTAKLEKESNQQGTGEVDLNGPTTGEEELLGFPLCGLSMSKSKWQ